MDALTEKKQRELRAFAAACETGLPILAEDVVPGEKPDLRVTTATGIVGIELSEILPLPRSASFNSSLAEASLQEDSVRLAERFILGMSKEREIRSGKWRTRSPAS